MTEFASHPAAILSDGSYAVFAKFDDGADGLERFEIELAGLRLLSEQAGVHTPTPIGTLRVAGGSVLVLEAVQAVEREPCHWRQIGQALARIHNVRWIHFGLDAHNYFGPFYQDNTPLDDWPTFYAARRLRPALRSAIDAGHLPPDLIRQVERLIARLPELCGPETAPALLHGDAQQNNFVSTTRGTFVVDPAVYYGNPETDLAWIDYFQAVPQDVFDGYREERRIDPGFWDRRDLWRIRGHLACLAVDGAGHYLGKLIGAVQKYL
jgi:fructosamine-3-kinase